MPGISEKGALDLDEDIVPNKLGFEEMRARRQELLDRYFGGTSFEEFDRATRAGAYDHELEPFVSSLGFAALRIYTYSQETQALEDIAA